MLCRVLLTAAAVSYLICMLLLSGLDKDDLDVNTLKKLNRHNVNINDMDDLNKRQECIAKAILEYQNHNTQAENNDEQNKTLQSKEPYKTQRGGHTNGQIQENIDLKSIIKYAANQRIGVPAFDDIDDIMKKQTETHHNNIQNDYKVDNVETSAETGSNNGLPTYENLIGLWKMYGPKPNVKTTTRSPHTFNNHNDVDVNSEHYDPKKSEFNASAPAIQVEYMSRMLAEFVSKSKSVTTATVKSITKETDTSNSLAFQWIPERGESPFLFGPNNRNVKEMSPNLDDTNVDTKEYDHLRNKSNKTKNSSLQKTINDILMFKKNFGQFPVRLKDNEENAREDRYIPDNRGVYANRVTRKRYNTQHETTTGGTSTMVPGKLFRDTTTLPADMIKEIAESVKAILLRDIRKEITTTTTEATTTTTRVPTTTATTTTTCTTNTPTTSTTKMTTTTERKTTEKVADPSANDTTHVLQKFMELFQQLKTQNIKETTVITANANYKITKKKNIKNEYSVPQIPYYGNQQISSDSNLPKSINVFRPQPINQAVMQNIPLQSKDMYHPVAITMQTNLNQIPPLGIPVPKQMSLINQNIIVTTKNPFAVPFKPKSVDHSRDYLYQKEHVENEVNTHSTIIIDPKKSKNIKDIAAKKNQTDRSQNFIDISKRDRPNPIQNAYSVALVDRNRNDKVSTYHPSPNHAEGNDLALNQLANIRERNDMLLKMYSDLPKTSRNNENPIRDNHWNAYRDAARYTKDRETDNMKESYSNSGWTYKPRYESDYERAKPRHGYNIKRFHEQLEGYFPRNAREPGVAYRDNSHKERPAPRQQLPLAKVNKSHYDDTHFRNFLQTQQKVNDMLERILATKNKFDRVRSTEAV